MSICQIEEKQAGRSYPRTCPTCKLGKCSKGHDYESMRALIKELETNINIKANFIEKLIDDSTYDYHLIQQLRTENEQLRKALKERNNGF